jgi:hypothetical protein
MQSHEYTPQVTLHINTSPGTFNSTLCDHLSNPPWLFCVNLTYQTDNLTWRCKRGRGFPTGKRRKRLLYYDYICRRRGFVRIRNKYSLFLVYLLEHIIA